MSELEAWMYFLASDQPEDIRRVIQEYPEFEEMYREIIWFRYHPEEMMSMLPEAIRMLDEGSFQTMLETRDEKLRRQAVAIEENRQTIEEDRKIIEENRQTIEENRQTIEESRRTIEENRQTIEENRQIIAEKDRELAERDKTIMELQQVIAQLQEKPVN